MVEVTVFAFHSLEGFEGLSGLKNQRRLRCMVNESGDLLLVVLFVTVCLLSYV